MYGQEFKEGNKQYLEQIKKCSLKARESAESWKDEEEVKFTTGGRASVSIKTKQQLESPQQRETAEHSTSIS